MTAARRIAIRILALACTCSVVAAQPAPKPNPNKAGSVQPKPQRFAARVLSTGIDSKQFSQIVAPTLERGESVKIVDGNHIALSATTQTVARVSALASQVRSALNRPLRRVELRAAVLSDQEPETTSTANPAIPVERLGEALASIGAGSGDFHGLPLPPKLWKLAELSVPATGGGENRAALSDRLTLLYNLRETPAGGYEVQVSLAEKDKNASPFDTGSLGRILLTNEFHTEPGRPVVLGVTNPARTTILALVLQPTN